MHVYLTGSGTVGIRSHFRPTAGHRGMYVVYEWIEGKFRMAPFPEISPSRLCSDQFLYVGKLSDPPML